MQKFMRLLRRTAIALVSILVLLVVVVGYAAYRFVSPDYSKIGHVLDEPLKALDETGAPKPRLADSFLAADEEYFVDMDKGDLLPKNIDKNTKIDKVAKITGLGKEEVRRAAVKGQNMWLVWTGGNDRFWDQMARYYSYGSFDLLKIISSNKEILGYDRNNRFEFFGLINEPCFRAPKENEADRYGLYLDIREPSDGCTETDPFANEEKYPGVRIGARGKNIPVGSYYGEPTGVIGLRLFPNPDFDEEAEKRWDAKRYYNDPTYYGDRDLVRPYRVGMSCAFCHVGPNPINPPADPENPTWEEITSNPGAQYFWVNRVFYWKSKPRSEYNVPEPFEHNIIYQLFNTNPPGALDTSLISTDYMNNPRTMNAVYEVLPRLGPANAWGTEQLTKGELNNKQFNDYPITQSLSDMWDARSSKVKTPRVLKDAADSVGVLGALNRVYLNIGLFSDEWLEHFFPVIGGKIITPIEIETVQRNSTYWNVTENQTPYMAAFFLVSASADKLADAPNGSTYLNADEQTLTRGKVIFAENCAACHSSVIPVPPQDSGVDTGVCEGGGSGVHYRDCWESYWSWTQSDDFKSRMTEMVLNPSSDGKEHCEGDLFLCDNFLSNERRVPIDLMKTNACTAIATNALKGDIWDNFSSTTYKELPPVGDLTVYHPVSGAAQKFTPQGNGRGYLRPASLISLWSSAPYLSNNSVGHFYAEKIYAYADPSVENRMKVFEESIAQMLNPELRKRDTQTDSPVPGYIYRTTTPSCVLVAKGFLPSPLQSFTGVLNWAAPWAINEQGDVAIGPFPKDMPINLLLNTQLVPDHDQDISTWKHLSKLASLGSELVGVLKEAGGHCDPEELNASGANARVKEIFDKSNLVEELMKNSKCPDYVVNRGHYFGHDLSADDKLALIEYLKTF